MGKIALTMELNKDIMKIDDDDDIILDDARKHKLCNTFNVALFIFEGWEIAFFQLY